MINVITILSYHKTCRYLNMYHNDNIIAMIIISNFVCFTGSSIQYNPVGFSAYATSDETYAPYESIEFPGIISNIGDYYDNNTSSFTCPRRAVYIFSLNVLAQYGYYVHLELMRDGEFIAEAMCSDGAYSHDQTTSVSVVIECDAGQVVWVSSGGNNAFVEGGSSRNSVFTGYMLYPYE